MKMSKACYDELSALYRRTGLDGLQKQAEARDLFIDFWLTRSPGERRRIVNQCIELSSEALKSLENAKNTVRVAEAQQDLLGYYREAFELATESKTMTSLFETCMQVSKDATASFRHLGDDEGILDSLNFSIWLLAVVAQAVLPADRFQALAGETRQLELDLQQVSARLGEPYAMCLAAEASGDIAFDLDGEYAKAFSFYEKAANAAQIARDSLIIGRTTAAAAEVSEWLGLKEEYVDNRREVLQKGLSHASKAIEALQIPFHTSHLARAHYAYGACCTSLANLVETEKERKKDQLKKAIDATRRGAFLETGTRAWRQVAHGLSKALYFLATLEQDPLVKIQLLKEALKTREETVATVELLQPNSWSQGVMLNYLALIRAELAETEKDREVKTNLMAKAVSEMRRCIELCAKSATTSGLERLLAQYCESYGDTLVKLHAIAPEAQTARQGIRAYQDSITHLAKSGATGPIGSVRWKIARVHDTLGDYEVASRAFSEAAEAYRNAAKAVPGAETSFAELGEYTDAWAEMERARCQHVEGNYESAYKDYERAAEHLRKTAKWNDLSRLIYARSLLERGEALSREEKHADSIKSFSAALSSLRETIDQLQMTLRQFAGRDQNQELEDWLRIAKHRKSFAEGRIELEEARSLDKAGEKGASSAKYRSASRAFEMLAGEITSAEDKDEMETIARFCESWSKMKEAESRASPELFAEAAESFVKAHVKAANPSLRLLALGNASICRALESGTKFRQSRDARLYSEIKRHLEIASDHYTEAGFKKTGTWTRATQRLFDALMLLTNAEIEREVAKKTELYHLAEKHLELAAKLYGEAGFPRRKLETIEQLEQTREEKEVLLAPLEALADVTTASAANLPTISLRGAKPLGLERFEEANIAGEIRIPKRDVSLGSELTITVDMVNVGKTLATLIRLEGMVPEGFEPKAQNGHPMKGASLDLRGVRLDYLNTHETRVSLRAIRKGNFDLTPRAVFVDQKGNFRSYDFRPTVLAVRDLAVSEAMRSPPNIAIAGEFQFGSERSKEVFRHLVKALLDDHMTRRIVADRAGWRSMMDVVRELAIPRSALYGREGRKGAILAELEHRGLIETRIFPGERGRGGEITKIRVAYDNSIVKQIVERAVMQNPS